MPAEEGIGRDPGVQVTAYPSPEARGLCGPAPALGGGEPETVRTERLSADAILFLERVNDVTRLLVDPARDGHDEELQHVGKRRQTGRAEQRRSAVTNVATRRASRVESARRTASTGFLDSTRVLRVMRAHGLLSPHRGRQGDPQLHDGTIITAAPHVMWGTDGVRVFTVDDGWVWTFAAVDHWNAECVGWHVCKVGNRFAALEPIAHGLRQRYGSVDADVARGLALRMDHGSQYLSDHFLHQIRYWGIRPSFGFLEEPETNGVAERWNRTLKEQAIYGRVFQRLDDVRAAVADFVERYNQSWRLEKLGYQTPIEAREAYELRPAA